MQDVVGGQIPIAFETTSVIVPQLDSGRIRALATTGTARPASLPDVPIMKELGYSKFVVTNWYGVFVPKDMPADLVNSLNASMREIQKTPEITEALTKLDSQNVGYDTAQYQQFVKKESPFWESLVRQTGAKVD